MDDDPGLPIKFGPCSNAEYVPAPRTEVEREAIRRAREAADRNARALGVSRRDFLVSICGAATTLIALQGCVQDSGGGDGGRYVLPLGADRDPGAARSTLAGEEYVFDVQGHHLEYDLMPAGRGEPFFGSVFPQVSCGEDDPRDCFAREVFLEEFFLRSDTSMVTLSALPIAPEGSPLSAAIMEETRHTAELVCGWESVLLHAQALPNVGPLGANLEAMEEHSERYEISAWKVFTHFPDAFGTPGNAWRLDDADPRLPQVGHAFIEKARDLGIPRICAHKGFSAGSRHGSPEDVPRAARDFPEVAFIVYHSGFERTGPPEGPYRRGAPVVGEDNVLWGTDCIFYGSPQDQIQAFCSFEITPELQERYGYPALTRELKAKVLGLNGARVYDVEPVARECSFSRRELEEIRASLPQRFATYGPRNAREVRAVRDHHRGWPG